MGRFDKKERKKERIMKTYTEKERLDLNEK